VQHVGGRGTRGSRGSRQSGASEHDDHARSVAPRRMLRRSGQVVETRGDGLAGRPNRR
jgi:hypothetical protein